jgi:hypothetical protein
VLATLSRWRSRVQIPPRILTDAPVVKRRSCHPAKVEVLVQLQAGVLEEHPRSVPAARDSPKIEDQVRFLAGIVRNDSGAARAVERLLEAQEELVRLQSPELATVPDERSVQTC